MCQDCAKRIRKAMRAQGYRLFKPHSNFSCEGCAFEGGPYPGCCVVSCTRRHACSNDHCLRSGIWVKGESEEDPANEITQDVEYPLNDSLCGPAEIRRTKERIAVITRVQRWVQRWLHAVFILVLSSLVVLSYLDGRPNAVPWVGGVILGCAVYSLVRKTGGRR